MDNFYLTDEDIHGCEEENKIEELEYKLNMANKKIEQLKELINEADEILKGVFE